MADGSDQPAAKGDFTQVLGDKIDLSAMQFAFGDLVITYNATFQSAHIKADPDNKGSIDSALILHNFTGVIVTEDFII